MAGWIAVFRGIPWMQLIVAAPAIARGARRLWTEIRQPSETGATGGRADRLESLEAQVAELKRELLASTQVIQAMAEQNERLLEAVGILRMRVLMLAGVCLIALVLSIAVAVQVF